MIARVDRTNGSNSLEFILRIDNDKKVFKKWREVFSWFWKRVQFIYTVRNRLFLSNKNVRHLTSPSFASWLVATVFFLNIKHNNLGKQLHLVFSRFILNSLLKKILLKEIHTHTLCVWTNFRTGCYYYRWKFIYEVCYDTRAIDSVVGDRRWSKQVKQNELHTPRAEIMDTPCIFHKNWPFSLLFIYIYKMSVDYEIKTKVLSQKHSSHLNK